MGENVESLNKIRKNDKCMVKFLLGGLQSLNSLVKISLKYDWIRINVDEILRQIDY